MPRVTSSERYRRHRFLQMLWREPGLDVFFSLLSTSAQWQLHNYYRPDEDLDELEFSSDCKALDQSDPSLCHVAGKHFKTLELAFVTASREFGVDRNQMNQAVMAVATQSELRTRSSLSRRRVRVSPSPVQIAVIAKQPDAKTVAHMFLKLAEYHASHDENSEGISPACD